jgi:hypothetical protein
VEGVVVDSWKYFHDKASEVLFQIVFPPKSIVGFVSKLKQCLFRKRRRFFPNFNIIGSIVKELHLSKVEGVIMEFMEGFP